MIGSGGSPRRWKFWGGAAIVVVTTTAAIGALLRGEEQAETQRVVRQMSDFLTSRRHELEIVLPYPVSLTVSDPVFILDESTLLRQVGEVRALVDQGTIIPSRSGEVTAARVLLYPSAPDAAGYDLVYHTTPTSLGWVVEKLFPDHRRDQIAEELRGLIETEREAILAELGPWIEESWRGLIEVVSTEFPRTVEAHRVELDALASRYYEQMVRRELSPLVRDQIWPLVRSRVEPEMRQVGRELWQRVSLWRFGWRFLYDSSPLPDRNLTEQEWQRFIEREAQPILEQATPRFITLVQTLMRDVASHPELQAVLTRQGRSLVTDPELRVLIETMLRETLVDNPRFRAEVDRIARDPKQRERLRVIGQRIEPALRRIGDQVFGTREEGITPEFAAVLRLQILSKDKRWLLLTPRGDEQPSPVPVSIR